MRRLRPILRRDLGEGRLAAQQMMGQQRHELLAVKVGEVSSSSSSARSSSLAPTLIAGRYVVLALATDEVLADAATMIELVDIVRSRRLRASFVRAPRDDESLIDHPG